ncbi:MAG: WbqC family protein [Nitrospinales bacterium]
MKLGIMQPYFFPYIGYWQLINAVDKFVVYDDVTFIKQGWINRNLILVNNKKHLITLETFGASSNRLINRVEVGKRKNKILKTIEQNYCKAPYFKNSFFLIEKAMECKEENIASFLLNSIRLVSGYLGIKTKILMSSEIEKNNHLNGEEKVIEICKKLHATEYYNPVGGRELYSHSKFTSQNIKLFFIQSLPFQYVQFNSTFVPNLSIIDLLMFNSTNELRKQVGMYKIL